MFSKRHGVFKFMLFGTTMIRCQTCSFIVNDVSLEKYAKSSYIKDRDVVCIKEVGRNCISRRETDEDSILTFERRSF